MASSSSSSLPSSSSTSQSGRKFISKIDHDVLVDQLKQKALQECLPQENEVVHHCLSLLLFHCCAGAGVTELLMVLLLLFVCLFR